MVWYSVKTIRMENFGVFIGNMLWANQYLQILDVHCALVQAVVSERQVKVAGEI